MQYNIIYRLLRRNLHIDIALLLTTVENLQTLNTGYTGLISSVL